MSITVEELAIPWRLILINSYNMERIDELKQLSETNISVLHNMPGETRFTYPMDADHAEKIKPYKTGILAERFNWRETLARRENGLYGQVWDGIWSGYVLPMDLDWTAGKMQVSCVGWLNRLAKRITRQKLIYNSLDDGEIILQLLQHANLLPAEIEQHDGGINSSVAADGYTIKWPLGSIPNTPTMIKYGGPQPNEGIGGSTAYLPLSEVSMGSTSRDLTVEKYTDILPQITNLVNLENSCDIYVDPVTRALSVHRRRLRDKRDHIIGFNWGPGNAAQFSSRHDAEQMVNYLQAQGNPGSTVPQYADDLLSMEEIGPLEEVHNLGNVTNSQSLLAFAGAEIIVRSPGVITYNITPFNYVPESGVPEPFVDYRDGDLLSTHAHHDKIEPVIGEARVFGINVALNENRERISQLQLSP